MKTTCKDQGEWYFHILIAHKVTLLYTKTCTCGGGGMWLRREGWGRGCGSGGDVVKEEGDVVKEEGCG